MKHLLFAVAAAGAVTLSANIADAATFTYNVYDHSDGTQTDAPDYMDYGLRLDDLYGSGDERSFWSFEDADDGMSDVRNNSLATLQVDLMAGTATLSGQMRYNFDDSLWDIDITYTELASISGSGATESFGAGNMFGVLTDGTTTYSIEGKAKPNGLFDFTLAFEDGLTEGGNNVDVSYRTGPLGETSTGAGWVSSIDGGQTMVSGTNDFLYTVELTTAPLPATAWFLIAGLGGLGAMRRFKKA